MSGRGRWCSRSPPVSMIRSAPSAGHGSASRISASGVGTNAIVMRSATSQSRRRSGAATVAASGTWRLAPATNAGHVSHTDASNAGLAIHDARSPGRTAKVRVCQSTRCDRFAWVTCTPLGAPVEPDVEMTYATSSPSSSASRALAHTSTARSTETNFAPASASRAPTAAFPSRKRARASRTVATRRASGCAGSSARYAPPDFHTASAATTAAAERSWQSATGTPGPTPTERSRCASPFARPSSSAKVRAPPASVIATAFGCARVVARNRACTDGASRPPSSPTRPYIAVDPPG